MSRRWWQRVTDREVRPTRPAGPSRARTFKPLLEQLEARHLLSVYTAAVLADGPVAYWRLGEAAGTTAFDASDHGATGTYLNGVVLGQLGALAEDADTAAGFDGVDDHVSFANPVADDFTIEVWVKTTATSLTGGQAFEGNGLVWSDVHGVANDWVLAVLNDRVAFFTGNPDTTISGTTLINDGNYHHIVATRVRGGDKQLYVDGELQVSGPTNNSALNANPLIEVGGNTLDSHYFNGTLDEVAVYDHALSLDRIVAHFQAGHDHSPVANADLATTAEAAPVAIPVLANDHDPDGDPLHITAVTPPTHGTATLNDNGTPANPADDFIVYAPAADFVGVDSFSYTISDGFGGTAPATVTVTVNNLAPLVNAGSNVALVEGGTFSGGGSFSDPGAETWTATVDYGAGTQPLTLNPDKTFALSHTFADSGVYHVTVTVTDSHGGSGSGMLVVAVGNVAPTATFTLTNGGPAEEGGTATVTFVNAFDPSPADTEAGFHYAYDFNNDGTFEVGDGSYGGSSIADTAIVSAAFLDDGPGTRTVRGRILDQDGGFTDYTTAIGISNVAPTAAFSGPASVAEGSTATVAFTAQFDPSAADTAAGFRYSYDFDSDGTFEVTDSTASSAVVPASYLDDGPGNRTVKGRIKDKDGGFTDYTFTIALSNVSPTASFSGPASVPEGATATVTFTGPSDPSATDAGAGFHYAYDLDNDGVFDVGDGTYANSGTAATADVPPNLLDDGPGSRTVKGRILDKDGGFTDYTFTIALSNVDPTASFSGPASVPTGGTAVVSFGGQSDASSADTVAGFRYAYDFDNNGTFDLGDGTYAGSSAAASATVPAALLDSAGARTIRGRILDKDGGFTDHTFTITVTSVTPTAGIDGPADAVRGQTRTFTLTATDPSSANQAAGFTYVIDWGDGTPVETIGPTPYNGAGVTVDHVFTHTGTFTVKLTATNQDGGSSVATHAVAVTAMALQTNPFDPTKRDLVVGGTTGNDVITLWPGCGGTVRVLFGDSGQGVFAPTGRLVVFGQAGNDVILVAGGIPVPAWLYGGAGNDVLVVSTGNNVLLGGTGDDVLYGGSGRDLLIAGRGADVVFGNGGDDLAIGGTTAYDANDAALTAIMAEWTSGHSFATRVANLSNTGGSLASRLNGDFFLLGSGSGQTVFNDGASDYLSGGFGSDWLLAGPEDWIAGLSAADLAFLFP